MKNENSYIATREQVREFIEELKEVLNSPHCDLDILPKKKGEESHDPYTTENTLIDLEYDTNDVKDELKKLTEKYYIETIKDNKNEDRPHFWVFGEEINLKEVYIKVKIKNRAKTKCFAYLFIMQDIHLKMDLLNNYWIKKRKR